MDGKTPVLREWVVYKEEHGKDWLGDVNYRYMLFTNEAGSDEFHWSGGRSYTTLSDKWLPVKSYGLFSKGSEFEDTIIATFEKEYRRPVAIDIDKLYDKSQPEGWLSPAGEWYPVHFGGHTDEARYIMRNVLMGDHEEVSEAYALLHIRGWLSIHSGWIMNDDAANEHGVRYSMEQIYALDKLRLGSTSARWQDHFDETLPRVMEARSVVGYVPQGS